MISLLSNNIYESFIDNFRSVTSSIKIISPFIGKNTSALLAGIIKENSIEVEIITRFSKKDFYDQVSSIEGLKQLNEAGAVIKAVKGLHTKLYIFDDNLIIIGSSNFTDGGLSNNIELDLLIEGENEIIFQANQYYNEFSNSINNDFILSKEKIEEEYNFFKNLGLTSKSFKRDFDRRYDFGDSLKVKKKIDIIEDVINMEIDEPLENCDSWLKFEGLVEQRLPKNEIIYREKIDGIYKTSFPKRPRGVKAGDVIILAHLSYNEMNKPMPMIFGYGITDGYNNNNVYSSEEINERPILERFPYFIELNNLKMINTAAENCIPMSQFYSMLGEKAFPTTKNKIISSDKLQQMHYRRDKLRITTDAKEYLIKEIDKKIETYGTI